MDFWTLLKDNNTKIIAAAGPEHYYSYLRDSAGFDVAVRISIDSKVTMVMVMLKNAPSIKIQALIPVL